MRLWFGGEGGWVRRWVVCMILRAKGGNEAWKYQGQMQMLDALRC